MRLTTMVTLITFIRNLMCRSEKSELLTMVINAIVGKIHAKEVIYKLPGFSIGKSVFRII
jgi:hypothetical protein